jgi:hypothetical protein
MMMGAVGPPVPVVGLDARGEDPDLVDGIRRGVAARDECAQAAHLDRVPAHRLHAAALDRDAKRLPVELIVRTYAHLRGPVHHEHTRGGPLPRDHGHLSVQRHDAQDRYPVGPLPQTEPEVRPRGRADVHLPGSAEPSPEPHRPLPDSGRLPRRDLPLLHPVALQIHSPLLSRQGAIVRIGVSEQVAVAEIGNQDHDVSGLDGRLDGLQHASPLVQPAADQVRDVHDRGNGTQRQRGRGQGAGVDPSSSR